MSFAKSTDVLRLDVNISNKDSIPACYLRALGPRCGSIAVLILLACVAIESSNGREQDQRCHLKATANDTLQQVRILLEVDGSLKLNPDGTNISKLPLQLRAELAYAERITDKDRQPTIVRHYHKSEANIEIDGQRQTNRLRDSCRLIAVDSKSNPPSLFSPLGPLSRDELELIDVPGNSVILGQLLPDKTVAIGQTWPVPEKTVAALLGLEAITQSNFVCKLRTVEREVAIIDVQGNVTGAVSGVATEMVVSAKLNFNLNHRNVSWLAMSIKENRSIGHADAGYNVTMRIRMALAPSKEYGELNERILSQIPLEKMPGSELLRFQSEAGGYQGLIDRRWRMMSDHPKLAIMRFVDEGDLLAQCNLSRLPALESGKQLPLEELQNDVKQALGDKFSQFVEASQYVSDRGNRVLRVVALGNVTDLAIQWHYYHLSNDRGERLAVVFTLEEELAERFAEADQMLVNSLEFSATDSKKTASLEKSFDPVDKPSENVGNSKPESRLRR